jgi:hypothetical protein
VARSIRSGKGWQLEFDHHRILVEVRCREEAYIALGADSFVNPQMIAVIVDSVPGVESRAWQVEPGGVFGITPGPETELLIGEPETLSYEELQQQMGELIHGREWPTIQVPAVAAKVGAWAQDVSPVSDPFIKPWMIDLADQHFPVSGELARRLDPIQVGLRVVEPASRFRVDGVRRAHHL